MKEKEGSLTIFLLYIIKNSSPKLDHVSWILALIQMEKFSSLILVVHTINSLQAHTSSSSLNALTFIFKLSCLKPEVKDYFLHFSHHKLRTWAKHISALRFQVKLE
jgi:hypothetical protein